MGIKIRNVSKRSVLTFYGGTGFLKKLIVLLVLLCLWLFLELIIHLLKFGQVKKPSCNKRIVYLNRGDKINFQIM